MNRPNRNFGRIAKSLLLLFVIGASGGCAALVDAPVQPTGPITDVRAIYLPVAIVGDTLVYSTRDSNCDMRMNRFDTTTIVTQGAILNAHNFPPPGVMPAGIAQFHTTIVHKKDHGMDLPGDTLFAVDQNQAFNVSYYEENHTIYVSRWVDLQQPIKDSASWKFSTGAFDSITARVTLYDFTAAVNGVSYSHVTEVTYSGDPHGPDDGVLLIKWYAQGVGLIRSIVHDYSHGHHITDRRLIHHN